jgi:hypothetical protein
MKEKAVNEMLGDLAARVPWALFGFSKDLEKAWTKNPASVVATVDARYQQYKTQPASAAAAAATSGS